MDARKEDISGIASGRRRSKDGSLSWGYSSFCGKRMTMEDFYDMKISVFDGLTICMFGVFDGHGDSRAAEYLKEHLFDNLMKHPQFMTDTKLAISKTYQQTDVDFLESETDTFHYEGSTASTAVLIGNHLYVSNVGDSRTVISKAGKGNWRASLAISCQYAYDLHVTVITGMTGTSVDILLVVLK